MRRTKTLSFFILILAICLLPSCGALAAEPNTVLKDFIAKPDPAYKWEVIDSTTQENVVIHRLLLTSQVWRGGEWTHQLTVILPDVIQPSGHALLFISAGGNKDGKPTLTDASRADIRMMIPIAGKTGSPVAVLRQVPNQPLYDNLREDKLISYTFDQYLKTGDASWPLLLPMVKSAVRGMDAVVEFVRQERNVAIEKFIVSGASKRGWTTWLVGAADPRVAAIAPMVIDTLNFEKQMPYQLKVWGEYSRKIGDYTNLELQQRMESERGKWLNGIVDPYSYIKDIEVPKLIFIGTRDPYWPIDAVKHYYDVLVGPKFIHYTPNAGHGLASGEEAARTLGGFFADRVSGVDCPDFSSKAEVKDGSFVLEITTDTRPKAFRLWGVASESRDFRIPSVGSSILNCMTLVESEGREGSTVLAFKLPPETYSAFYGEMVLPSATFGEYSICTRMYVVDKDGIVDREN